MAVPAERLERQAEVLAMWFVTDHFTRDDGDGRSFVEWSGVVDLVWRSSATVDVTVRTRRLAAVDGEPYARLPEEAWRVGLEIGDQGWTVASGPVAVDDAHLVAVEAAPGSEWTDAAGLTWMVDESDRP